jgi:hypothetical protein
VKQTTVDDANRLPCLDCTEEFISWKGETQPYWLDPGKEPDNAWEKRFDFTLEHSWRRLA